MALVWRSPPDIRRDRELVITDHEIPLQMPILRVWLDRPASEPGLHRRVLRARCAHRDLGDRDRA